MKQCFPFIIPYLLIISSNIKQLVGLLFLQVATILAKQLVQLRKQRTKSYAIGSRVQSIGTQAKVSCPGFCPCQVVCIWLKYLQNKHRTYEFSKFYFLFGHKFSSAPVFWLKLFILTFVSGYAFKYENGRRNGDNYKGKKISLSPLLYAKLHYFFMATYGLHLRKHPT